MAVTDCGCGLRLRRGLRLRLRIAAAAAGEASRLGQAAIHRDRRGHVLEHVTLQRWKRWRGAVEGRGKAGAKGAAVSPQSRARSEHATLQRVEVLAGVRSWEAVRRARREAATGSERVDGDQ